MLSVDGVLYAWLNTQNGSDPDFRLAWSNDMGATWSQANWAYRGSDFGEITFLNFGKDYANARDGYVYSYAVKRPFPRTTIELARVPKQQITDRNAYEFFAGLDVSGNPKWTSDITARKPVFEDTSGIGIASVSYNAGIGRYLLTTAHALDATYGLDNLGIFDSPTPWGPWTTAAYYETWGNFPSRWLAYYIPTKTPNWMSQDGTTIHLLFSGVGELDSFNLVKGTITLRSSQLPGLPATPSGVNAVKK